MDKIARAKPADLVDSCYAPMASESSRRRRSAAGGAMSCIRRFRRRGWSAGGPASNDVLKCQLKPLDLKDYRVALTDGQKARLAAIFPAGVCNFSVSGVEQQPLAGSWLTF